MKNSLIGFSFYSAGDLVGDSLKAAFRLPLLMRGAAFLWVLFSLTGGSALAFNDIDGHWAEESIQRLSQHELIGGYEDGSFRPEGRMNLAEFTVLVMKGLRVTPDVENNATAYTGIEAPQWAIRYLEAAKERRLLPESTGGKVTPQNPVTRMDVMVMLSKAAKLPRPTAESAAGILDRFIDGQDVPRWARRDVAAVIQQGVFTNYPDTRLIEPRLTASRGEVAVMMQKALLPVNDLPDSQHHQPGRKFNGPGSSPGPMGFGRVSQVIPAQAELPAVLTVPVSSEKSHKGDFITLKLDPAVRNQEPFNRIPENSEIQGRIVRVCPAGYKGRQGLIGIDFFQLLLPNGQTIPMEAGIASEDELLHGRKPDDEDPQENAITGADNRNTAESDTKNLMTLEESSENKTELPLKTGESPSEGDKIFAEDAFPISPATVPQTQDLQPAMEKGVGDPVSLAEGETLMLRLKKPIYLPDSVVQTFRLEEKSTP